MSRDDRKAIEWLRHIQEHWERSRAAYLTGGVGPQDESAADFAARWPDKNPFNMTISQDDIRLGEVLSVRELLAFLKRAEERVISVEQQEEQLLGR
jgi:FMN phosphatase YigB (HAD superfamily)